MRPIIASSSCALMLAFAACTENVGYVEIKVAPGFALPPILLGTSRIDPARGEGAVLREPVGTARLQFERDGRLIPFCEFDVRKDRIVTVAVSAFGRDPRCKVQG